MNIPTAICIAIGFGIGATSHLAAADIKVIANSSVCASSVTATELKAVFLQTKTSLDRGCHVQPVILTSSVYAGFSRNYLGKTTTALETYYRSLVFSGTGAIPKKLSSDSEVADYVSKTKGAIGYISSGAATMGTTVLHVK